MDKLQLTLHNPLTEEEWDLITDVDFDNTEEITFHTKHGKEVKFVKQKTGHWIIKKDNEGRTYGECSVCGAVQHAGKINFCYECGSDMRKQL